MYFYESKAISSMNSVANRLLEASRQSDRILLDITDIAESRKLAEELKTFFENNPHVKDVLVFKGKKEIHISNQIVNSKRFIIEFMKIWNK